MIGWSRIRFQDDNMILSTFQQEGLYEDTPSTLRHPFLRTGDSADQVAPSTRARSPDLMEHGARFQGLTPSPTSLQWSPEEAEEVAYSCAPPQFASEWADPLVLHQFNPAWDILAFLRFHPSLRVHVVHSRYPSYAATGALPQLQDGHFRLGGGALNILQHIQTHHLKDSTPQSVLCHALNHVVSTIGQGILNASAFGNPTTYHEVTRVQLASQTLFPSLSFAVLR